MAKNSATGDEKKRRPWEDIPDFTIYFYDPVRSLFSGNPPAFIDYHGKPVETRRETKQILQIAAEAAALLAKDFDAATLQREEWKEFLQSARTTLDDLRADLPLDRITFVNDAGDEIPGPPVRDDIPPQTIASFLTQTAAWPGAPAGLADMARHLWCLVCLTHIDSALLAQLHDDAGDALGSFADAAEALHKARGPGDRNASMALKGANARHEETRAIKRDVMQWLDENKTLDLVGDEVAGEIAGKIAPIKWRTARDYITEWKKLRSAGKP